MTTTATFCDSLRPEIRTLPAYNSGLSAELVRARYGAEEVAKLGSNENPWGASPRVIEAIAAAAGDVAMYPDPNSDALRQSLATKLGVAPQRLAFGNGSEDLISVCAHSFLAPGDEMITILPSFGLHAIYSQAIGAKVRMIPATPDYAIDVDGINRRFDALKRAMVMFSAPSNPLGSTITREQMERLLHSLGNETLLIFDEAYYEYASADPSYPGFLDMLEQQGRTWIMLRTFSKAYGLAGLRVGYGIASDPSLIDVIDRARTPFNVNRFSQVAALVALEETSHLKDSIARTIADREKMRASLLGMGYQISPSVANFLFFNAREDAANLALKLLPHGVIVKPWKEPGYQDHVRVSMDLRDRMKCS